MGRGAYVFLGLEMKISFHLLGLQLGKDNTDPTWRAATTNDNKTDPKTEQISARVETIRPDTKSGSTQKKNIH